MIKIWRFSDGEMIKTLANSDNSSVYSMAYLKRDRIACTANQVNLKHFYALIWNWRTATQLLSIQTRVCKIILVAEDTFATCDKSKKIKLWQLEPGPYESDEREDLA